MPQVTDLEVRNLKPLATRFTHWFGDGLGLRVAPTGRRTWFYWYRHGARKRALTLGEYPATSVKAALALHAQARVAVAEGGDPGESKQVELRAARAAAKNAVIDTRRRPTLREVFERWVELDLKSRLDDEGNRIGRKDNGDSARAQFERWVFPKLGSTIAFEVSKGDVMEILDKAKGEGKRRTAGSIFSNLRQMFDFAADREYVDRNPLLAIRKLRVTGKVVPRRRVLADWELTRLLRRLPLVGMHAVTVLALRFILATGQRPGEVAGMTKAELNKEGTLWTIPAARYKTGETQLVPLSALAQSIMKEAALFNTSSAFVFPSPQAVGVQLGAMDDRCIDRHSLSRAVARKLGKAVPPEIDPDAGSLGLEHFVPHDLRRTVRTQLAALGVTEHIAERVIGHRLQGMMAVYNLHDYLDERRDALERWGKKLLALA